MGCDLPQRLPFRPCANGRFPHPLFTRVGFHGLPFHRSTFSIAIQGPSSAGAAGEFQAEHTVEEPSVRRSPRRSPGWTGTAVGPVAGRFRPQAGILRSRLPGKAVEFGRPKLVSLQGPRGHSSRPKWRARKSRSISPNTTSTACRSTIAAPTPSWTGSCGPQPWPKTSPTSRESFRRRISSRTIPKAACP
jgi:hypothetical protein